MIRQLYGEASAIDPNKAIEDMAAEFMRNVQEGTKGSLAQLVNRSGMSSSLVSNLAAATTREASRPLLQTMTEARLKMPWQAVNAKAGIAGLMNQFVSSYYTQPRMQDRTVQTDSQTTGTTTGETSGFKMGF